MLSGCSVYFEGYFVGTLINYNDSYFVLNKSPKFAHEFLRVFIANMPV